VREAQASAGASAPAEESAGATARLRAAADGGTHLVLSGVVKPVPAPEDVEQLLTVLASLTGGSVPVQVVLEVARTHQAWTEAWVDTLSGVSADGFQLRFVAATAGDEDAL